MEKEKGVVYFFVTSWGSITIDTSSNSLDSELRKSRSEWHCRRIPYERSVGSVLIDPAEIRSLAGLTAEQFSDQQILFEFLCGLLRCETGLVSYSITQLFDKVGTYVLTAVFEQKKT